ncbi:MAG: histidine phosphatase family protein [Chloroflexota bacterium]
MPFLFLTRHGENEFVKKGKLAGRMPNIHLNERGRAQAEALGNAFANIPLSALYSSPLERALETAGPIAKACKLTTIEVPGLLESDVGRWQGKSWKGLMKTEAWTLIQQSPSRFRFPGGESFPEMQTRVVSALEGIYERHKKPQDVVAVVFHADPIKLAVAHFIGLPLDHFQRLACDTGSVTLLAISKGSAQLLWMNRLPPFDIPQL